MSPARALQAAIYSALVADAGVHAVVGDNIIDGASASTGFPYVEFGPSQEIEDDAECIDGETHIVQLDIWDRSQGRLGPAKDIVAAVKAALHRQELTIAGPYAIAFVWVSDARTMADPDGITAHGIVEVRAAVEI